MLQLELSLFSLWANIAAAGWLTACIEQYSDPELGLQERQNPFFKRSLPAIVSAGHRQTPSASKTSQPSCFCYRGLCDGRTWSDLNGSRNHTVFLVIGRPTASGFSSTMN